MMKKILGYIAVLMVFSWMTTANASPIVADISGSNGLLTISGFNTGPNPDVTFLFDFTAGQSGTVNVSEPITIGQNYNVHIGFEIPALPIPNLPAPNPGPVFSADFDIVSLFAFNPADFPLSVDDILNGLIVQNTTSFTPTNAFLTVDGDTFQLNNVNILGNLGAPQLELIAQSISGTKLTDYLNHIDGSLTGGANGIVSTAFTNANAEVRVPEPMTLLLLGSGLLGLLGFSKKRA